MPAFATASSSTCAAVMPSTASPRSGLLVIVLPSVSCAALASGPLGVKFANTPVPSAIGPSALGQPPLAPHFSQKASFGLKLSDFICFHSATPSGGTIWAITISAPAAFALLMKDEYDVVPTGNFAR